MEGFELQKPNNVRRRVVLGILAVGALTLGIVGGTMAMGHAEGATKGRVPQSAFTPNGAVDTSQVPDYVSVEDKTGTVVGYAPKDDLFPTPGQPISADQRVIPVYDSSLSKIIGHVYPGVGYVPHGEPVPQPSGPSAPTTTTLPPTGTGS
jgi:hypothetical protein